MNEYKRITRRNYHHQNIELINELGKFIIPNCGEVTEKALCRLAELEDKIESGTLVDVQEVRHGKWIGYPSITISKRRRTVQSIIYKCSRCGTSNGRTKSPYCKNCGALMDGDDGEPKIKELEGEG